LQSIGTFHSIDVIHCDPQIAEIVRVESGVPMYGRDITDENLPQEVNRNAQAISFTKGCYLGQETVARIDALGHVNKLLVGLKISGATVPTAGTELTAQGKVVGHVTSAVFSPRLNAPLALGYVRTGNNEVGNRVESPLGSAEVIALPLSDS
jgi:folate-binding protein YgfZ